MTILDKIILNEIDEKAKRYNSFKNGMKEDEGLNQARIYAYEWITRVCNGEDYDPAPYIQLYDEKIGRNE